MAVSVLIKSGGVCKGFEGEFDHFDLPNKCIRRSPGVKYEEVVSPRLARLNISHSGRSNGSGRGGKDNVLRSAPLCSRPELRPANTFPRTCNLIELRREGSRLLGPSIPDLHAPGSSVLTIMTRGISSLLVALGGCSVVRIGQPKRVAATRHGVREHRGVICMTVQTDEAYPETRVPKIIEHNQAQSMRMLCFKFQ